MKGETEYKPNAHLAKGNRRRLIRILCSRRVKAREATYDIIRKNFIWKRNYVKELEGEEERETLKVF